MTFYSLVIVLVIFRLYQVLAQQSCYWPDGSDALNFTVNCYPSQESACCWPNEVYISDGLCFVPNIGTVC